MSIRVRGRRGGWSIEGGLTTHAPARKQLIDALRRHSVGKKNGLGWKGERGRGRVDKFKAATNPLSLGVGIMPLNCFGRG